MRARLACRVCRQPVENGALTCSQACDQKYDEHWSYVTQSLVDAGFVQDECTPNIYRKFDTALSVEHVHHVGLDQAILEHGHAVKE